MSHLYEATDYKDVVRARLRELSKARRGLTLKRVAQKIPIQYTYLSKALRDEKTHLNEDHFFTLCKILEYLPDEIEYLTLIRAHTISQDAARRSHLFGKLERLRRTRELHAEVQTFENSQLNQEMGYLFDPLCPIIHVSLFIPEYHANPRRLCAALGISTARLHECLKKLRDIGFVELEGEEKILGILKTQLHYGTDHPLMRVHQALLRHHVTAQLSKTSDADKHCFMTTFSSDRETFLKVQEKFRAFLQEVQKLAMASRPQNTYQLSFDLLKVV